MVREIPLTQGYVALVDDEDFEKIAQHKWHAEIYCLPSGKEYVRARRQVKNVNNASGWSSVFMSSCVMPGVPNVLFIDGNTMNLQKKNLLGASTSQRNAGRRKDTGQLSRFKGVCLHRKSGRWIAKIGARKTEQYLGIFDNEEDAAHAYDEAAAKRYGEFARLNFPHGAERVA